MHVTDDQLAKIEQLSAGGTDIKALNRFLRTQTVPASAMMLRTKRSELPRHMLLRGLQLDTTQALSPLRHSRIWSDLAGSGAGYTGLFGALDAHGVPQDLADAGIVVEPFKANDLPAPVAERASQCVRLLASPLAWQNRWLVPRIQQHLNGILLEHPVLMHPGFLCRSVAPGDRIEFTSIAHALAHSTYGSLPRMRHFPGNLGAECPDPAVLERLRKFFSHACVQLGLKTSVVIHPESRVKRQQSPAPGMLERGALADNSRGGNPLFVASVMEMDALLPPGGRAPPAAAPAFTAPLPLMSGLEPSTVDAVKYEVGAALANVFFAACGLDTEQTGAAGGAATDIGLDEEVLGLLRARSDAVAARGVKLAALSIQIFGPVWALFDAPEVKRRTQLICRAMVRARMPISVVTGRTSVPPTGTETQMLGQVAAYVLAGCLGGAHLNVDPPSTHVAGAIAFLEAVDELGALDSMSPYPGSPALSASETLDRCEQLVERRPQPDWAAALHAFRIRRQMVSAMDGTVAPVATPHSAPACAAAPRLRL